MERAPFETRERCGSLSSGGASRKKSKVGQPPAASVLVVPAEKNRPPPRARVGRYWPLPVRLRVLEPAEVLSVMVSVESRVPLMVGVKVMVTTQVAPAGSVL